MKHDLEEAYKAIENLTEKLSLKELRDEEIERLKKKAEEFEHYMRNSSKTTMTVSSSMTNSSLSKNNVSTSTSPDFTRENCAELSVKNRQVETKIRDEMAKIFASEMKIVEKRYREECDHMKNKLIMLSEEMEEKDQELNVRQQQFEILKFTILKEREESNNELMQKDQDFTVAIEKYRKEHELNQHRLEELTSQLSDNKDLIDEERNSIQNLKRQLNDERKAILRRETEKEKKINKLQKVIEELNDKYLSAKKTAHNYKQYSIEKEAHMMREYDRIKEGYKISTEKVQNRMKEFMESKETSCQEQLKKLESEYEFKIDVLKDGLMKRLQK